MRQGVLLAACLLPVLAGCTGMGGMRAGATIPDEASPAAQVYISRCGSCHALPHPGRHGYDAWVYLVSIMEQRMAERGMGGLTDEERADILAYLHEHAR